MHSLRITGIYVNSEEGIFNSVSDDGTFKTTECEDGETLDEQRPSQGALKQLVPFNHRNCMGVSDSKGNMHLYTKAGSPPESIVSI